MLEIFVPMDRPKSKVDSQRSPVNRDKYDDAPQRVVDESFATCLWTS
jgi:hypothetical protein